MSTKVGEMLAIREAGETVSFEARTTLPNLSFFKADRSRTAQGHMFRRYYVTRAKREIGWLHEAGLDDQDRQLVHMVINPGKGAVFLVAVEVQPGLFAIHRDPADQACLAAYGEDTDTAA